MCDCRTKIEAKLTERAKEQLPESKDVQVQLKGYGFLLSDSGIEMKNLMNYEVEHTATVKGALKHKKLKQQMIGNYCMFCGESYERNTAPLAG